MFRTLVLVLSGLILLENAAPSAELEPEQQAEHKRMREELEKVSKHYRALSDKLFGKDSERTKEQLEQLEKEQQEARKRMTELRSKLPAESERHGWVWLFLRKEISRSSAD